MKPQLTRPRRPAPLQVAGALGIAALTALLPPVHAQQSKPVDPGDPQAKVPALHHLSSLARYRPLQEVPVGSWQDANAKARLAGGWRAYAREKASEPDAAIKTHERQQQPAAR